MQKHLKIAVIAGEESGDLLAADLITNLRKRLKVDIELIGVGGPNLQALGLKSYFNHEDIAIMGITAVLSKLPRLISHVYNLSNYFASQQPDFLLVVDSQEFSHNVAKRVRKKAPFVPIVQYVAPTIWAWRAERAHKIRKFIDLLLVVFPFEPQLLAKLNGPKSIYVGHRLLSYPPVIRAYEMQKEKQAKVKLAKNSVKRVLSNTVIDDRKTVLVLPGSRKKEINKLMPVFGEAIEKVKELNPDVEVVLPTLPHLESDIRELAENWKYKPYIVTREYEKWAAFSKADAALAASGTVALELALCSIPVVLAYKIDWLETHLILPKITAWSAALPNIITDEPLIPEFYNEYVRPVMLARQVNRLLEPGSAREAQLEGFEKLRAIMKTNKSAADLAIDALIESGYCYRNF